MYLNETCKNAVNVDSFINHLVYELADPKLMIGSYYVDGTCSILRKNLKVLPLDRRPLHCMKEDPHQQLMHIRQDDKWNVSTFVNWL